MGRGGGGISRERKAGGEEKTFRYRRAAEGFLKPNLHMFDLIFLQFFRIEDCDPVPMGHWVITEAPGLQRFY